uniref:Uncharacterized protein n=1 Tax=Ananas comosus var. bracteatus TaxID=296719 RepID=A0A6V7NPD4_ANACO|nr:unnamed protein product [Ananas comosus var. bracteatus]
MRHLVEQVADGGNDAVILLQDLLVIGEGDVAILEQTEKGEAAIHRQVRRELWVALGRTASERVASTLAALSARALGAMATAALGGVGVTAVADNFGTTRTASSRRRASARRLWSNAAASKVTPWVVVDEERRCSLVELGEGAQRSSVRACAGRASPQSGGKKMSCLRGDNSRVFPESSSSSSSLAVVAVNRRRHRSGSHGRAAWERDTKKKSRPRSVMRCGGARAAAPWRTSSVAQTSSGKRDGLELWDRGWFEDRGMMGSWV